MQERKLVEVEAGRTVKYDDNESKDRYNVE